MKTQRQAAITRLIRAERIASQEQLRARLAAQGMDVTQATLSRDIRELGLAKVADPDGGSFYSAPPATDAVHPPLLQLVGTLLLSLEGVGPLLILRTPAGSANTLGSALDHAGWTEVIGTIAGDDTLLLICRSDAARKAVATRLRSITDPG
jgi:transcriptional regulator of arginine metabolism